MELNESKRSNRFLIFDILEFTFQVLNLIEIETIQLFLHFLLSNCLVVLL
jgi:hypothetical protein